MEKLGDVDSPEVARMLRLTCLVEARARRERWRRAVV